MFCILDCLVFACLVSGLLVSVVVLHVCVCVQTMDLEQYYMRTDVEFLANNIMMDLAFLAMNWRHMLGRPTYVIVASELFDGNLWTKILLRAYTFITVQIMGLLIKFGKFYLFHTVGSKLFGLTWLKTDLDKYSQNKPEPIVINFL